MNLEKLIKKCVKQDRKAQEELYNRYKQVLFVLSLKYCKNLTEAEDNMHNSFVEIFTSISNYKNTGSFEGWIKKITINKAISLYKNTFHLSILNENIPEDTTIDEDDMKISLDYLLNLIQNLPNQYRLVFCLYQLDDYSHKEISEMLSISESTSKSNLHRAKLILKHKILSEKKSTKIDER